MGAGACIACSIHLTPTRAAVVLVLGATCIQGRLLCNLFDGMVAVEGGFKTKSGEVFNELPDRFADAFILVGCGYAARTLSGGVELGWTAAILAIITAYIRTLGAATGAGQNFMGPMAKQHRMAAATAACVLAAAAGFFGYASHVLWIALLAIVAGELITVGRRTAWVITTLESKISS